MTSLSQQLQRLAVPFTQSVFGTDRKRPSLLFDPKEAANLDREAVFAIGQGGLEELENVESRFIEFEATLFNLSSQNWERSLQTAEVNEQLDETIRHFLIMLSPYFPLKSAHKALEWLIYRYHIHQFNRDDLLLCILPYHETKIFVRVLQLLKLEDATDKWNWLHPSVKNGLPLARGTLINHCAKDPGFMAFILEMVPAFIKVHGADSAQLRGILALYTCAVLGALQEKSNITERVMSVIVPHLARGLKSKCVEYKAANYMVLSQLVVQVTLQVSLINTLVPVITKHFHPRLVREALLCLTLVFQTQSLDSLPKKAFKHICKTAGIIALLSGLSQQFDLDKLVVAMCKRLIPLAVELGDSGSYSSSDGAEDILVGKPPYFTLLTGIVSEVNIVSMEARIEIASSILGELLERRESLDLTEAVNEWKQRASTLLTTLENRHSEALDVAVRDLMTSLSGDDTSLSTLQELTALTHRPTRYEAVPDAQTNLLLGLKHHSPHVRALTVRHLSTYLQTSQSDDANFLEDLVLERLHDDEVTVVSAVLNMKTLLLKVIDQRKLVDSLLSLLKKVIGIAAWSSVHQQTLRVLCEISTQEEIPDLSLDLLPYLVVLDPGSVNSAEIVLTSCGGLIQDAFTGIKSKWQKLAAATKNQDNIAKMNLLVIDKFTQYLEKQTEGRQSSMLMDLSDKCTDFPLYQLLLLCVLGDLVAKVKVKVVVMEALLKLLETSKMCPDLIPSAQTPESYTCPLLMPQWLGYIHDNGAQNLPLSLGVMCGFRLSGALGGADFKDVRPFGPEMQTSAIVVKFMDMLMRSASPKNEKIWRAVLLDLVKKLPFENTVDILCRIWTSFMDTASSPNVSPHLHVGSYYVFRHILQQATENQLTALCDAQKPVLMLLVLSLLDGRLSVRHAAVDCLQMLQEVAGDYLGVHKPLVARILRQQEEIVADAAHTPYTVGKLFSKVKGDKSPKSTTKLQSVALLSDWITATDTPLRVKVKLTELITRVPHEHVLLKLLPLADDILRQCATPSSELMKGQGHIQGRMALLSAVLARFDDECANIMANKSPAETTFVTAVTMATGPPGCESPQSVALRQLTHDFFHQVPGLETQQKLVTTLLDAAEKSASPQFRSELNSCMRKLKLAGCHVTHELEIKDEEISTVKGRKKTRTKKSTDELNYCRLVFLLEVIQVRKKIRDAEPLALALFSLLSRLQQDTQAETEYTKQLVLGCLLNICKHWTQDTKPPTQESINIESLVMCIRSSSSPQTQQQAMMVMSAIAPLYPEYILHNVMSIFTFVGSNLLQHDDAYSFQLITGTLDTIVPALIKACAEKETEADRLIENILRVFVDARRHIPKHRSSVLFHQLTARVGAERHLWRIVVLLVESAVRTRDVPEVTDIVQDVMEEGKSAVDKDIDLAVSICTQFDVELQIQTLSKVLGFLKDLTGHLVTSHTQTGSKKSKGNVTVPVVAMDTLSSQQLRLTEYHTARAITALLSNDVFIASVLDKSEKESLTPEYKSLFRHLVKECLDLLNKVTKGYSHYGNTTTGKFWRAVVHKIYDILDRVNYLLPSSMFLTLASSLLDHENVAICRKSLELLSNKLQAITPENIKESEVAALLEILPQIVGVAGMEGSTEPETDVVALRQMALFSLKVLCKLLGQKHPKDFKAMLVLTVRILSTAGHPLPITSSALLCVAELTATLRAHVLPHLAAFMPQLMAVISDIELLKQQEILLVCSLTALQKIVGTLPNFLTPYLQDILLSVCKISSFMEQNTSAKKSQASLRLRAVKHQLATTLEARVLIPELSKALKTLLNTDQRALVPLFEIGRERVETLDKSEVPTHQGALVSYFCDSLDLRNATPQLTLEELSTVEERAMDMVLSLVMKLSEVSFRPMFYRLYDWACREDDITYRNRQLSFFRLAEKLSDKLRSLFNLFIGHAIKTACSLLNKNNTMHGDVSYYGDDSQTTQKSCLLIGYIIGCLHKCFLHDTEHFVDKEMFTMLVQPLVDQLENTIGGELAYQERICSHVTPCISQLAVALNDDSSWKVLNYQVLLKTRHESPKMRFATLQTVEALATKLGDEYMTLLPETVPFLAELMEDESEEVEQKCQQVVGSLEQLLGESIQQYF